MLTFSRSPIFVALTAGACVAFSAETAVSGQRCQIPAPGAASVCGPVEPPGDPADWRCPSFDPVSGGPRHAYFVRREKKGEKYKYKDAGYFVPGFNKVYTYKLPPPGKRP